MNNNQLQDFIEKLKRIEGEIQLLNEEKKELFADYKEQFDPKVLREAVRMLKPGGTLLVIDWKQGRFPLGPLAENKITSEEVDNIALGAGLKKVKEFEAGKFHYGMVFGKI